MRCVVPTNVPSSEKILKLYDAGRSGGGGITGRPWPGSLHTIRGAPGSLKHVQPALISVLGVKPSAVAAVVIPSETAAAAIQSANLIILFPFRRKMPPDRRRSHIGLRASSCQSARASATLAAALRVHSRTLAQATIAARRAVKGRRRRCRLPHHGRAVRRVRSRASAYAPRERWPGGSGHRAGNPRRCSRCRGRVPTGTPGRSRCPAGRAACCSDGSR
jgi:hypothetical protein